MTHQIFLTIRERNQADDHADTGRAKAVLPAEGLAQPAAKQRGGERADVDAHVENREATVAARVVLRVQFADDRGNIGLQITNTHHD